MAAKEIAKQTKRSNWPFLTKSEEVHPFSIFRDEVNRVMEDFFNSFEMEPFTKKSDVFSPNVDVTDTEKEIRVSVELPGMDEKDIDVSMTRETLTIKGEKKEEKEEKGKNYHRMERSYGSFVRVIPLPVEVETDKVQATFKKGVLTITLPKTDKALKEVKKVPIQAE